MRILLATLATPTYTSELYEFSLVDMAQLYETKAFVDTNGDAEERAIAWAQKVVDEREAYLADEDTPRIPKRFDRTEDLADGRHRIVFWSETEECLCEDSFCLDMRWQDA